jgi:hypothetical protein
LGEEKEEEEEVDAEEERQRTERTRNNSRIAPRSRDPGGGETKRIRCREAGDGESGDR